MKTELLKLKPEVSVLQNWMNWMTKGTFKTERPASRVSTSLKGNWLWNVADVKQGTSAVFTVCDSKETFIQRRKKPTGHAASIITTQWRIHRSKDQAHKAFVLKCDLA